LLENGKIELSPQGKMTRNSKVIDGIIIILNVSVGFTIIPLILFDRSNSAVSNVGVIITNLIFFIFRFKNPKAPFRKVNTIIYILFSLYIVEVIKAIIGVTPRLEYAISILLLFATFYLILFNLNKEYDYKNDGDGNFLTFLINIYVIFAIVNVVLIDLTFILLELKIIEPYAHQINQLFYGLFKGNVEFNHTDYYAPGYLSIMGKGNDIGRIPFFQQYGSICGVTNEPHVIDYLITPSLFFILRNRVKLLKRTIILLLYFIALLINISATNITALLLTFLIYIVYRFSLKNLIKIGTFLALLLFILNASFSSKITDGIYTFVLGKWMETSGSKIYSLERTFYILNPKTLLGSTIYTVAIGKSLDIGYIPFILNLTFVFLFFIMSVKLIRCKKQYFFMIGLGIIYFLIHSAKITLLNYQYTYMFYILYVLILSRKYLEKVLKYEKEI